MNHHLRVKNHKLCIHWKSVTPIRVIVPGSDKSDQVRSKEKAVWLNSLDQEPLIGIKEPLISDEPFMKVNYIQ